MTTKTRAELELAYRASLPAHYELSLEAAKVAELEDLTGTVRS